MPGDPFLNYFALGVLVFVVLVLFYGIIAIHDVPHLIAKSRNHPHQDAIHAAGWVSLFTLHVLWPLLWIWAMAWRPDRGWGFGTAGRDASPTLTAAELEELRKRIGSTSSADLSALASQVEELRALVARAPDAAQIAKLATELAEANRRIVAVESKIGSGAS